jgi:hypothetical protein
MKENPQNSLFNLMQRHIRTRQNAAADAVVHQEQSTKLGPHHSTKTPQSADRSAP